MNAFDNQKMEAQRKAYAQEAKAKWGDTDAYKECMDRTKDYSKEKWNEITSGMNALMAEFAVCQKNGSAPDSEDTQALVKQWQDFITRNCYTCTKEILAGLGEMYAADERFKANIDKHGDGTAQFMREAIRVYCS